MMPSLQVVLGGASGLFGDQWFGVKALLSFAAGGLSL
jgi:hypothetical protein